MKNMLRWVHGTARQTESREGAKLFRAPGNETQLERVGLSSLAVFGLLCHLLIFWLLFFPYAYTYDPYYQAPGSSSYGLTFITTGWQAMGFMLIFPVFSYLLCLLPMLRKSARRKKQLEESLYLNVLVNLGGFLLMCGVLLFSLFGDFNNQRHWLDGMHLAILFLAVLCSSVSSVLLGSLMRRSRTKLR